MDGKLSIRLGKSDADLVDMLNRTLAKWPNMDHAKLVKLSLRAVLPCLVNGECKPDDVCAIDGTTGRKICILRTCCKEAKHDLNDLLDQLEEEICRTPPGTIHGPLQFRPADEQERAMRVKLRVQDAAAILNRIAESIVT